ncbi:flagellar biosynthetic protein FliQ [Citromicrobium bathyomarinum]|jgi:flagellar biosynthesis protein FliQ|uniref:Flagellar biosynthetic protein FliQ n=1 Tax=Alteriqipengyuania abyssalis TaxID=2860200 RepID=A0ABS7PFN5_9SPHN|nr:MULTISPECIES: flagellar biosynthetic protein FliQ [Sphingomonadales]MBY8337880.1 flagellar biosynthetic protein FliQ [Alteriqipengyuania abyssalis]MCD1623216.1 flagellar biosynthetic protein FliQ [Citromicrobium bathyomarinum]MEC8179823.1 flagellar biosynthetic protein FliQ [Pseudomonadota bacterium]
MTSTDAIQIAHAALIVILTISGPMLFTSLVIGVAIGLLQALTQIQEMTLTFVPKLFVMGFVLLLCLPMIGDAMGNFMAQVSDRIVAG